MKTFFYKTVDSTFDTAFELAGNGFLNIWDSVQAEIQTHGRGQMRSQWVSQKGNLFASLRLPCLPPFTSTAGAVAMGALCISAIKQYACGILLKWPNDLAMRKGSELFKVGGILLEERGDTLLAGIGLNLLHAPASSELDEKNAIMPGAISSLCPEAALPAVPELWQNMTAYMQTFYEKNDFQVKWRAIANGSLAWRDMDVCVSDGSRKACGILLEIASNGGCLLRTSDGNEIWTSGTMRKN